MLGFALIAAGTALVGMGYKSQLASLRCRAGAVLPTRSKMLDEVNNAADASFPASDPPAFTPSVGKRAAGSTSNDWRARRSGDAGLERGGRRLRAIAEVHAAAPAESRAPANAPSNDCRRRRVLIEAIVDCTARLGRPVILRGTPPEHRWCSMQCRHSRFEPARTAGPDGVEAAIDMPITIAGLFRPPVLTNTPTIGESPKDWSRPSGDAAYPISMEMPNYPPQVRDGGIVLLEVSLNGAGGVTDTRGVVSVGGFESASREALTKWRFTGAIVSRAAGADDSLCVVRIQIPYFLVTGATLQMPPVAKPPFPPAISNLRRPELSAAAAADFKPPPPAAIRRRRRRISGLRRRAKP